MQDFLNSILDILAVLFGDEPERPRQPTAFPTALPPASPPTPRADPDEPQDGADLEGKDSVVVSHEGEEVAAGETPEFDDNPLPPPGEEGQDGEDTSAPPRANPPAPEYRARYMWCIDNGHGSLSAGKRSPPWQDGKRLEEWEFNRDITRRIFAQLDNIGVAYYNVTPEIEIGNWLAERVARANRLSSSLPKIYLSVHGNAGPAADLDSYTSDSARGIETWYYHGSTKGRSIAAVFQRHLIEQTGMPNRHLRSKVTGQFYVLRATRMPAVLTENGFYNNRYDLPIMLTDRFRQKVADAHVAAIMELETADN